MKPASRPAPPRSATDRPLVNLRHAIVIEDDDIQRRLARAVLQQIGFVQVLEASDGSEALQVLAQSSGTVDLALCDLDMAGMDGIQMLSRLARDYPGIAVVLLSAQAPSVIAAVGNMAAASGLDVAGTMRKPIDRAELASIVHTLDQSSRKLLRSPQPDAMDAEEIRRGLAAGEFEPYYQPKIELASGRLCGAEALARWNHPQHGLLAPGRFIASAEAAGLMGLLTWSVIDQSFEALACWLAEGHRISLSVNLSASLFDDESAAEALCARAIQHAVPTDRITLELTESMATRNLPGMIGGLARLRMRGFGLAIDDFGTGYSSLQQLSAIPFSEMKIDRSFVSGAGKEPHLRAILESSVQLGRRLGLETTAEGVETLSEEALVRLAGCETGQGFLYSPAVPRAEFTRLMQAWVSRNAR